MTQSEYNQKIAALNARILKALDTIAAENIRIMSNRIELAATTRSLAMLRLESLMAANLKR